MDNLAPEERKKRLKYTHFFVEPDNLYDNANRGCATVAILKDNDDKYYYGVALCSPLDNFSRPIGRAISSGRLLSPKGKTRNRLLISSEPQPENEAEAAERALNEYLSLSENRPQ